MTHGQQKAHQEDFVEEQEDMVLNQENDEQNQMDDDFIVRDMPLKYAQN